MIGFPLLLLTIGCQGAVGQRRGIRTFQPTHVEGYLEYVTHRRNRKQTPKSGLAKTESKEDISEENLSLKMDGYVYHPNFLEFALGGLFGLLQHDYEETYGGQKRRSGEDGTVLEYDFEGNFFQKKKYPGTVYARRYRSLEPRAFQPSLEVTTTTYGASWRYVDEKHPTSFEFSHSELKLDPRSNDEKPGSKDQTTARVETAWRFSEHNVLSLLYAYESLKEEPFHLDYDTHEVTLGHLLAFGDRKQHRLESELNYYSQRGTFNVERSRWRELLRFEHSENLKSWYQFELLDRKQGNLAGVPPLEERSYTLRGTLEHRLYESLITQLFAFGQTQRFASGLNIDRYGSYVDFDYRKKNAWGVLQGGYRFRAEREESSGGDQDVEVLDESATFRDPEPVTLRSPNIQTSTILITAEDRYTVYQNGKDYTVQTVGDNVEIRRVATGRISDGQTVLIDYVFNLGGSYTLDTLNHQFRIRQNFAFGLSPYYELRLQDQSLSPPTSTGARAEDITDHLVGLEFRRGTVYLQAEYEDYDSTISPYRVLRLGGSYTRRFNTGATASITTRWTDMAQSAPNRRDTEFFTVEGRYRQPITRAFLFEGAVMYRNEMDSIDGRDEGIDVDLGLEWHIRTTDIKVTYEFDGYRDRFADNEATVLYVQVRRRF